MPSGLKKDQNGIQPVFNMASGVFTGRSSDVGKGTKGTPRAQGYQWAPHNPNMQNPSNPTQGVSSGTAATPRREPTTNEVISTALSSRYRAEMGIPETYTRRTLVSKGSDDPSNPVAPVYKEETVNRYANRRIVPTFTRSGGDK